MQQFVQTIRTGNLTLTEVAVPMVKPGYLVVASSCSVISAGIEKMTMELAQNSLRGKDVAAEREPDR
jgi:hypothetical protein